MLNYFKKESERDTLNSYYICALPVVECGMLFIENKSTSVLHSEIL